jgi:hypothetical protein
MIGALLSPSSPWSKMGIFELLYLVALHGRTELDAGFGLLSQTVKILELGPVLDTPELIAERLTEEFAGMIKDPNIHYYFLVFVILLYFFYPIIAILL